MLEEKFQEGRKLSSPTSTTFLALRKLLCDKEEESSREFPAKSTTE
jgi:hypothetical protein